MDLIALLIGIIIGIIIGVLTGKFLLKGTSGSDSGLVSKLESDLRERSSALAQKEEELKHAAAEKLEVERENAGLKARFETSEIQLEQARENLIHQKKEFEEQSKQMNSLLEDRFKHLAQEILEDKSKKFTEMNSERLSNILTPLKEDISTFKKKVEEVYTSDTKDRTELKVKIEQLQELNKQLSEDASNLVKALKGDSKTQGDWGEAQLEVILEKAGLQKEVHFTTQDTYRGEDGKLRKPDFLVNLPENKHLVIDAKVSLTAYEQYHSSEDKEDQKRFMKMHLDSVRNHIKELGNRDYERIYEINTPDFVLMFIPVEAALFLALSNDKELYDEALRKNVVLVSTSTLLATMRTVRYIWTQEDQRKNILQIIDRTEKLYDKFRGFTEDMLKIGKHLDDSKGAYEAAMNKLKIGPGNLIGQVDKVRQLSGYHPKKAIDPSLVDTATDAALSPENDESDA